MNMSQTKPPGDFISVYVEKYRQSYIPISTVAAYVQDACRSALSSSGIIANVTSRAKDPDRLSNKLLKMYDKKDIKNTDDIEEKVVDFIGVRVTLYFPSQVEEVVTVFESLFPDVVLDTKLIPDTPIPADKLLKSLSEDNTMTNLGNTPTSKDAPKEEYKARYGNYRAVHVRFTLNKRGLGSELVKILGDRKLKVEIQIQTLLMHSWSEVNHDLSYKTLNGELSLAEHQLLDCLNGVGKLGEFVLVQLKKTLDFRLQQDITKFSSSVQLAEFIRPYVKASLKHPDPDRYVMGDVDDFLDFLNLVGKNTPTILKEFMNKYSTGNYDPHNPIVNILFVQMSKIQFDKKYPLLLKAASETLPENTAKPESEAVENKSISLPINQPQNDKIVDKATGKTSTQIKTTIQKDTAPQKIIDNKTGVQPKEPQKDKTAGNAADPGNDEKIKDQNEILATIFDMACRPIVLATPESQMKFTFCPAYSDLRGLAVYDETKSVTPKESFPVKRDTLDNPNVKAAMVKLAAWFENNYKEKPIVQYYLHLAYIRTWKKYANKHP